FEFYLGMFREGLAPAIGFNEIANKYQELERGTFAMMVTGPWELGEFARRLPDSLQSQWSTAVMPGPTGPGVSVGAGSSRGMFHGTQHPEAAWELMRFLSLAEQHG